MGSDNFENAIQVLINSYFLYKYNRKKKKPNYHKFRVYSWSKKPKKNDSHLILKAKSYC